MQPDAKQIVKAIPPTPAAPAPSPLRQVIGWIVDGHGEADIVEAISANWPKAKARPLIVQAIAEIGQAGRPDRDIMRGFCIEATRTIYRRAVEVGDHMAALKALKQLSELSKG